MLIVRLALGPMLVVHGANKAFGPGGIAGTTGWFEAIGLRPGWLHARVAAATEIAAGLLLSLGLLTGLACAAFVGLMLVAAVTDHRGKGYFVFKGGWEYVVLVAMVAVGIASVGPGEWSLDGLLDLDVSGAWWALGAAALGVAGAAVLLATSYRPAPRNRPGDAQDESVAS
ncbi:DoxX family protein [Nocardioides sp.]|uniref:DoxX family protein n=1 Tax=Nocardioides sp. TaxID=35761 RepID=UPI0039E442F4